MTGGFGNDGLQSRRAGARPAAAGTSVARCKVIPALTNDAVTILNLTRYSSGSGRELFPPLPDHLPVSHTVIPTEAEGPSPCGRNIERSTPGSGRQHGGATRSFGSDLRMTL